MSLVRLFENICSKASGSNGSKQAGRWRWRYQFFQVGLECRWHQFMKQVGSNVTFHTSAPSRWKNDGKKQWRAFGTNNRIATYSLAKCCWILCAFYVLSRWKHWHCVYVVSAYLACTSSADQHPCLTYVMVIQSSPKNSEGVPWSRGKARQCCQTCYKAKPNAARMAGRIDELLVWQNTNFHGNAISLSEGGSGQFTLSRSRIDASTISTMVLIVWLLQNNYSTKTSNLFKFAVPSFNTNLSSV